MGKRWTRTPKTQLGRTPRRPGRPGQALGELALLVVRSVLWVGFTAAGTALNMWGAVVLLLLISPSSIWGYLVLGFGAALAGGVGGAIAGFGQMLALHRWLNGAASLGSFLSTLLASSSALATGTVAGRWAHTIWGELPGAVAGVLVYGCVFGLIQRPMLDYMARRSILWVPANALAVVLGAVAVLAAFDVSGARRDALQFRYAGLVYSIVLGVAFLLMTRETRKAMAAGQWDTETAEDDPVLLSDATGDAGTRPALLEIHEHRVYRVYPVPPAPRAGQGRSVGAGDESKVMRDLGDKSERGSKDGEDGPDVIDVPYRVLP